MKQASLKLLSAAVILLAVIIQTGGAQEARATLGGRVLDPQTAAIPNADVVVRSEQHAPAEDRRRPPRRPVRQRPRLQHVWYFLI